MRAFLVGALLLMGCSRAEDHARAVCLLVDESGTYADQRPRVVGIIRRTILPGLLPGDHLVLVGIDSNSYDAENIRATLRLDRRPSRANGQKLAFLKSLDPGDAAVKPSRYTDIRGGLMLCSDHLADVRAAKKSIVLFSDLQERLPKGVRRSLPEGELASIRVAAINVKRLQADGKNPRSYRARIARWEKLVRKSGATDWRVIVSPDSLVTYLEEES